MENKIELFKNKELGEVRTLFIDGECWFVGKDVASCLGYTDTDQAIRNHVLDSEKLTRKIYGAGQKRNVTVINEKGTELKKFKNLVNDINLVDKRTPSLILWTEKGASRMCKILDTDKAWDKCSIISTEILREDYEPI